jgi:peptidoglycan/LPS O-acetylase OafA/YrhL
LDCFQISKLAKILLTNLIKKMFSKLKRLLLWSDVKVDLRNNAFDFVRLVAAIMVVYGHSGYLYGSKEIGWEPKYFDNMHSGTLAVWISTGLVDFILKRAKRIYPGFWINLLTCAFVFAPLIYFLKNKTFINFWELNGLDIWKFVSNNLDGEIRSGSIGSDVGGINGPLWTIHHELRSYLALGVIGLFGFVNISKKWFMLCIAVFFQITRAVYSFVPEFTSFYNVWFGDERILMFLSMFFWGSTIALYIEKQKPNLVIFGLSVILILLGTRFDFLPLVFPFCFVYSTLFLCFALPIKNISKKIGDLSYGIYLYHWPVRIALQFLGVQAMGLFWLFGLNLICTIPFAILSWNFIEKRFLARHKTLVTEKPLNY